MDASKPGHAGGDAHDRLPNAPLRIVACQVRFPTILRVSDREFVAPFQDRIRAEYPNVSTGSERSITFGPNGLQDSTAGITWRFANRANDLTVVLAETSLLLESKNYGGADDFFARYAELLEALEVHVRPALLQRLGLRYINEIRHPRVTSAPHWKGLISEPFLGPTASMIAEGYQVERTGQELVLRHGVQRELVVRHGHLPAGTITGTALGAPSTTPFYLLDLDHSTAEETEFNRARIMNLLTSFHEAIWHVFRSAVTDELFSFLQGRAEVRDVR